MSVAAHPSAPHRARLSPDIERLFPPGAVAAEFRGRADRSALVAAEARCAEAFAEKRVADFAAGRLCARRALRAFGILEVPLGIRADRRPDWPRGIVGSISHTRDFCGVVAAPSERFASIGFDAEIAGGVDDDLWPALFVAREIAFLRSLELSQRATAATVLFGAKEAYYKCHFGITPTWLDFTDVTVTLANVEGATHGTFDVCPNPGPQASGAASRTGRFAVQGDIVLTGVAALKAT